MNHDLNEIKKRLRAFYFRLGVPSCDVEGLTQEVFLRLLPKLNAERNPLPLAYTIARNERLRLLSRQGKRKIVEEESIRFLEISSEIESTENLLERKEQQELLKKLIEELSPQQKELLILKHYQNLSFQEVSQVLETPSSTLKYRMFQILSYLKRRAYENSN